MPMPKPTPKPKPEPKPDQVEAALEKYEEEMLGELDRIMAGDDPK